jgi:hypothetical protein
MHVLGSQRAAATVGGLAHLKVVERGPRHFASGTSARPHCFRNGLVPYKNIIDCGFSSNLAAGPQVF